VSIGLIWAQASGGVIGHDGGLPWHLPEDLARFKARTLGSTVIMGRTTWESLPASVRPLPGRRNVVLSRRTGWSAEGAEVVPSLAMAFQLAGTGDDGGDDGGDNGGDDSGDVWVIGGASVYAEALPLADLVVVTELLADFPGDTYAPDLDEQWVVVERDPEQGWHRSVSGIEHRVLTYQRAFA